ncbi:hypothetical protein FRB99_008845 [Tulasnella sp. 403]|nr:hypothetical protein FRB99_008845 [Tulasnella sp. 403]
MSENATFVSYSLEGRHALPTELLMDIIYLCLFDATEYHKALHLLARVCRLWRDIILSHRPFWSVIDSSFGAKWIQWALKRSGDTPLAILSRTNYASQKRYKPPSFEDFAPFILRNIHRCRRLIIHTEPITPLYHPILNKVQKILESPHSQRLESYSIVLPFSDQEPEVTVATLALDPSWKVRRLNLLGNYFPWGMPIAQNLMDLRMIQYLYDGSASFSGLTNLICDSPGLQRLELRHVGIKGEIPRTILSPIHLPFLTRLVIAKVPTEATRTLLHSIDAPNCRTLSIWCSLQHGAITLFDPSVKSLARLMRSVLDDVDYVMIRPRPDLFNFYAIRAPDRTRLYLTLENPPDIVGLLQSIFALDPRMSEKVKFLRLGGPNPHIPNAFVELLVQMFPLVENLGLITSKEDVNYTIQLASNPSRWPRLSELEVRTMGVLPGPLLDFLRARAVTCNGDSQIIRKFPRVELATMPKGEQSEIDEIKSLIECLDIELVSLSQVRSWVIRDL